MKVLVTGGAGFVGIHLINKLLLIGADVRATLHRKDPVIIDDRIEYVRCDLTMMQDCIRVVEGIDYVFLCAANTSGAAVMEKDPLVHVTPNIVMNSQMLDAAYKAGVEKVLWLSSTTGYPPSGDRPVKEDEMFDGEPYEKYYFVGWMKRFTEVLCRMYSEKLKIPMATIVLRPTNIYGEYDDFQFETSHVLPALIRKVVERNNPLEVWGTGDDVRDLVYVGDVADAMVLAMANIDRYDPVNIGLGRAYSVKEILRIICDIEDFHPEVIFDPTGPQMIPKRLVDVSKAEELLGWRPKMQLREGIEKTIEWYKRSR